VAVTDHRECVAALSAARVWLLRHHHDLTATQLCTMLHTGIALTHEVGFLLAATTPAPDITALTVTAAGAWRRAAAVADTLRTPGREGEVAVGPTALSAAEAWLCHQLRDGGQWRTFTRQEPGSRAVWSDTARTLVAHLPDLATLLDHAAQQSAEHGCFLAQTPPGPGHAGSRWTTVRLAPDGPAAIIAALGSSAGRRADVVSRPASLKRTS
jgi:hypothetical protein